MTIFAVTRGRIENGSLLGFLKLTEEQVLGCREVEPDDYKLAHGFVEMDVKVGPDDSVSVATDSIMSDLTVRSIKFGGSTLALSILEPTNKSISVTPNMGEAALIVGPDKDGVTLSLERHANNNVSPVAIGTLRIKNGLKPLKPKVNKEATFGGGHGSG